LLEQFKRPNVALKPYFIRHNSGLGLPRDARIVHMKLSHISLTGLVLRTLSTTAFALLIAIL